MQHFDQTSIQVDQAVFQKILEWIDCAPSADETDGMKRLLAGKPDWAR
jgi:hypothetical protein